MLPQGSLIVEDLHMTYQTAAGPVRAVQGVSFTIQAGEFYTTGRLGVWEDHDPALCRWARSTRAWAYCGG
jgi:hypothetical protein